MLQQQMIQQQHMQHAAAENDAVAHLGELREIDRRYSLHTKNPRSCIKALEKTVERVFTDNTENTISVIRSINWTKLMKLSLNSLSQITKNCQDECYSDSHHHHHLLPLPTLLVLSHNLQL